MLRTIITLALAIFVASPSAGGTFIGSPAQTHRAGLEGNAFWEALDATYTVTDCIPFTFQDSFESSGNINSCTAYDRVKLFFPFPIYIIQHSVTTTLGTTAGDDCAFAMTIDEGTSQVSGSELEFGVTGNNIAVGGHVAAPVGVWVPANTAIGLQGRGTAGLTSCSGAFGRAWWDISYIPGAL